MGIEIDRVLDDVPVEVKSQAYGDLILFRRADNTTQYTANDVVGDGGPIDLGVMGPRGGRVLIQSTRLQPRLAAVPGTAAMGNMRLALYRRRPSIIADNAAWTIPAGDVSSFIDLIDLGTPTLPATGAQIITVSRDNIGKEIKLGEGQDHLWAYLITDVGYTPAAALEVYAVAVFSEAL